MKWTGILFMMLFMMLFVVLCLIFMNHVEGFRRLKPVKTESKESDSLESKQQEQVFKLLRQIARWAAAAQQDTHPYIQNLHATYAVGYLLALREIYSDEFIKRVSGVDIEQLNNKVTETMDTAIQNLVKV